MLSIEEAKKLIEKINDYWIGENPDPGICAWERGTYFIGNMAAYEVTKKQEYLDYALKWADVNNWSFYDDADHMQKSADCHLCGITYLDLMDITGKGTDKNILKTVDNLVKDEVSDYWWWIDAIYMALAFFNKIGVRYKNEAYFDKAYKLFYNCGWERECYDESECLWFRDKRFFFDKRKTMSGKKEFWSRGNGWVFAGLARTLYEIPEDNKYYGKYLEIFKNMAEVLATLIQDDGFWHTSLIEPREFDYPETSGTVLFVLGYLMGINLGVLDEKYSDVALKGLDGLLNTALEESGRIGYVQVIADNPEQPVKKEFSSDYAVGTMLLVLREYIKYLENK